MATEAKLIEELVAYFDGQLTGTMGLRSHLGPLLEYRVRVTTSATPPEPEGGALAAARAARRVEETLELLSVEERAVLAAWCAPRGIGAPLDLVVRDEDGHADRVHAVGAGLRVLGGMAAVSCLMEPVDRLQGLARAAGGKKGPERSRAQRELRRVAARARRAVHESQEAYCRAARERRSQRRRERVERFRQSLGLAS